MRSDFLSKIRLTFMAISCRSSEPVAEWLLVTQYG
jgi:hypothetical protein